MHGRGNQYYVNLVDMVIVIATNLLCINHTHVTIISHIYIQSDNEASESVNVSHLCSGTLNSCMTIEWTMFNVIVVSELNIL